MNPLTAAQIRGSFCNSSMARVKSMTIPTDLPDQLWADLGFPPGEATPAGVRRRFYALCGASPRVELTDSVDRVLEIRVVGYGLDSNRRIVSPAR